VDTGDSYFASMLLVDGFLARLAANVGGRPVAFVPDRDTLIVGADGPGVLAGLYELVERQYMEAPRSISPVGYTVDERGAVVPYVAQPGTPLAGVVHRAEVLLASSEYGGQKQTLESRFERDLIDIFVASVMVVQRPDSSVCSVAVWAPDVDTLLPRTDVIAFQSSTERDGSPPLTIPFDVVAREAALVPEPEYAPPRYRVTAWPAQSVMDRLRPYAVTL
jgi:hypothetical protein